jgi:hypothetical protein
MLVGGVGEHLDDEGGFEGFAAPYAAAAHGQDGWPRTTDSG